MYEGSRDLLLPETEEKDAFYVYEPDGSAGVYKDAAAAVKAAEELSGVVINKAGDYVWMRGNRAVKTRLCPSRQKTAQKRPQVWLSA